MSESTKKNASATQINQSEMIKKAVAEGQKAIKEGETKISAAMKIYVILEELDQETVVKAMIDGASLTSKGALTYWYNCRRKIASERANIKRG